MDGRGIVVESGSVGECTVSVPWQVLNGVWKFTITNVNCVIHCEKMMPNTEEIVDLEASLRSGIDSMSNDFFGDTSMDTTNESKNNN